jgi:DNA invertase Pin-like site-specific DNA recombinase
VAQRDRLKEALRFVRRGDTLVACKPDRLARSTTDLLRIVDDLEGRGVGLIILSMGGQRIDTRSPTGKLMVTMLAAIAEFERGLLLERQREGVAKAKQDGKYKGRKPTARAKSAEVIRLDAEGFQPTEIAERLGIGVASVYRLLADAKVPSVRSHHRPHPGPPKPDAS